MTDKIDTTGRAPGWAGAQPGRAAEHWYALSAAEVA
jgi:hypothetical protein